MAETLWKTARVMALAGLFSAAVVWAVAAWLAPGTRGETVALWAVACRTPLGPVVLDNVYVSYAQGGHWRYAAAGGQVLSVPGAASICLEQANGGHACMDGGMSPQAELVHMGKCGAQRSEVSNRRSEEPASPQRAGPPHTARGSPGGPVNEGGHHG